ncbi:MAG TPA: M23 family metallopeptidase [Holophagaceae bacterium]|nr:M23 family metallopeptidase [Holophagaceae bacterium]
MSIALLLLACLPLVAQDPWLRAVPDRVWKAPEAGRGYEGWALDLVVGPGARAGLKPVALEVTLTAGGKPLEKTRLEAAALVALARPRYRLAPGAPATALQRAFALDEAFDLRLRFQRPQAWAVDGMSLRLELSEGDRTLVRTLEVPLGAYTPKTSLIFPFKGPGLLTQGPIQDGGHAGYANQHALDALALTADYAPQLNDRDENDAYAGWGHAVLAMADGVVVHARNDVPDNPRPGETLEKAWLTLPDPLTAVAGNCVVIDHGTGESTALMHLQKGSVAVKVGDHVKQGQVVGRLGSSGDSFGPHLHLQLMAGPRLFVDPSLPLRFTNLPGFNPVRGVYFAPK